VWPDEGYGGLVLRMANRGIFFSPEGNDVVAEAQAGESWDAFVSACVARGLRGLECLSGIPGTVGAAPIQNVGAYGQQVSDALVSVACLDRNSLERRQIPAAACAFGYRTSRFRGEDRGRFVIEAVRFRLHRGGPLAPRHAELSDALPPETASLEPARALGLLREAVLTLRRSKSMVVDPEDPESRSAGSFFLNPTLTRAEYEALLDRIGDGAVPSFETGGGFKIPAAWLIERAGYSRGYTKEGVGLSKRHALALVNRGGTTRELLDLAGEIREAVGSRFGIDLRIEPEIVGPDPP